MMHGIEATGESRLESRLSRGPFAAAVVTGLSQAQKSLPCRFFYDARGSALFERITQLPEYYPTRTETAILAAHARDMIETLPAHGVLIEFGSGSSLKTELLLAALPSSTAYVPVDVSPSALKEARLRLTRRFPRLDVRPLVADFSEAFLLAPELRNRPRMGFFPGSTIGNLTPTEAVRLLAEFRKTLPEPSRLVIGVDLKKDLGTLLAAYNDAAGVTAAFNLNILARINRELGAAIDLTRFRHDAFYNAREGRIEMHLVSRIRQDLWICDRRFRFSAGERIHTENSYKYSVDEFQDVAKAAGWSARRVWTDESDLFSVHELA